MSIDRKGVRFRRAIEVGRCTRRPGPYMDPETFRVRPISCGANLCTYCAPRKAIALGTAIALARLTSFVTLTLAGPNWATAHERMRSLIRRARGAGPLEVAYAVHEGPHGDTHVHALTRAEHAVNELLLATAPIKGFGIIRTGEPVREPDWIGYPLHPVTEARHYDLPEANALIARHLEINGDHLLHNSRDFFQDQQGHRLTMGQALASARTIRQRQCQAAGVALDDMDQPFTYPETPQ